MSDFTSWIWVLISTFLSIAYIFVMFLIVVDLFRDPELSGWSKVFWILGLLFIPFITALVYVVTRGSSMAQRQRAATQRAVAQTDAYVRDVAGTPPVDQIAKAKSLLDAGVINDDEFAKLKQRALAGAPA